MMKLWPLQREINKSFLYGIIACTLVGFLANALLVYLNNPTAIIILIGLLALWMICPIFLFPMMAIRIIRFVHRIGSPISAPLLFRRLTYFFAGLYTLISLVISGAIFLNISWLPVPLNEYFTLFNLQQSENIWYWCIAFVLTILSALALMWVVTIVYMLFRSQLMSHLSWWKKLGLLIVIATGIFLVMSQIFNMVAAIFPTIPLVPLTLANPDDVGTQFSISAVQALLQMLYVYLLIQANSYIYLGLYESEY